MRVPPEVQAVLLLTTRFSAQGGADPLSNPEWTRLSTWLTKQGRRPEDLLEEGRGALLDRWTDPEIGRGRLDSLLDRGSALAVVLDRWLGAGLFILTRADPRYPERLRQRLGPETPPVLFGAGDAVLLHRGGVAITGARNASAPDLEYAWHLGAGAAAAGVTVLSGGSRGIHEEALSGALEGGGAVVGVLADGLLRASAERRYRPHLMAGEMALVSPHHPDARPTPGAVTNRNRCIYGLADAAVVVHSGRTGDTFSAAAEVLQHGSVPLWVKPGNDARAGNADLIALGGLPLPDQAAQVDFSMLPWPEQAHLEVAAGSTRAAIPGAEVLYQTFVEQALRLCAEDALAADELAGALGLTSSQTEAWLERAVLDGRLERLADPVRYRRLHSTPGQLTLFDA